MGGWDAVRTYLQESSLRARAAGGLQRGPLASFCYQQRRASESGTRSRIARKGAPGMNPVPSLWLPWSVL